MMAQKQKSEAYQEEGYFSPDDFKLILKNPILDISAQIWEPNRYNAFKTFYRSMRIIDDLVDSHKSANTEITEGMKGQIMKSIGDWLVGPGTQAISIQKELFETISKFKLSLEPWQNLMGAMAYDLSNNGFRTFQDFLEYSEGAAVAPGSIFMHMCAIGAQGGVYVPPEFDAKAAARPLARFSYVVHIIRDFQADQEANLNYFADDLMAKHGIDRAMLKKIARGGEIPLGFRNFMNEYRTYAKQFQEESRQMLDDISPYLKPRYKLSLELIYSLYSQIFERIDIEQGKFTTEELNPTADEVMDRINETFRKFS